ncbi:MAG: SLC13 family permease [Petrimonas sp.]|jgi:di/tricarboxylate transporter|nr:MAG: Sodium-dependent dicarboxylate transporter SdcS [Bacteroidetes bacterium ADurb.BinA174]
MAITFVILFITAGLFIWGKLRSDVVALIALLGLTVTGILTPTEAITGFSNPIVLMLAGLFVISGAISQTGLAKTLSTKLLNTAKKNELKLFTLTMVVAAGLGSFMSNAGTAALLLPIVFSMTREADLSARRFLMPMAFSASMGGMMTLIGTPPVLIVNNVLMEKGYPELGFFTVFPIGFILLLVGLLFLWNSSNILQKNEKKRSSGFGEAKSPIELMREYQLSENLFRIKMNPKSSIIGLKLRDLNITRNYNVSILEIRTQSQGTGAFLKSVQHKLAEADTVLNGDDIIYVTGFFADVERFALENTLTLMDTSQTEVNKRAAAFAMKFDDIGIAEAVVLSSSKLVNKPVKESGFRNRYNVNILGIKRKSEYLLNKVQDEKIQAGDSLLIQGTWTHIDELDNEESDLVVVGKPSEEASKVTLEHKAATAATILIAMVIAILFKLLTPVVAILSAALLMILLGCFRNVEAAYNTIRWQTVVFFAAMIPMATAMDKTGAFDLITKMVLNTAGQYGPHAVLASFYFGALVLTMFISNATSVILFAPIAIQTAQDMNINPYPFLFAVATASVMCLASPYASPPNSMIMSPGGYSFMDYVKVGLPLQLIYMIVMILVLPIIYPF